MGEAWHALSSELSPSTRRLPDQDVALEGVEAFVNLGFRQSAARVIADLHQAACNCVGVAERCSKTRSMSQRTPWQATFSVTAS